MNVNGSEYGLCSVINHFGQTSGGHYTSFCKENVSERWYYYNDSRVEQIDFDEMEKRNADILFYHRVCRRTQVLRE